jgi:NADPH:quinone reductase-like Zn-dependent oxidoreductase
MSTMKAVRFYEYGGPEVLRYEEVPRPQPGDAQILVRVHAAGVNPVDVFIQSGQMSKTALPRITGFDFSGTVDQVGKLVKCFAAGEEVFGRPSFGMEGSYAEFVVVSLEDLAA